MAVTCMALSFSSHLLTTWTIWMGNTQCLGKLRKALIFLKNSINTYCDEGNRPFQDIRIYHTVILDDPYEDPGGLIIPSVSPLPTEEMLNSDHIACDADIDEDKDKTEEELAEMMAEKEAKANTQILEMVGDLPNADVAPPENVLFVCKLNPVTTAEDLEVIFSRFGPVVNCDVIKDSKTGESLQYAFIEFENPQHCENAYFKMDNVLIDDRRIHVDFSQSVSKLKWKGKGKGVEIISTGDAPVYVLKNQHRSNNQYDLVYEHDDVRADFKKRTDLAGGAKSQQKRKTSPSPVHRSINEHKSRGHKSKRSRSFDTEQDGTSKDTDELEFQSQKSHSRIERHNFKKETRQTEHFERTEFNEKSNARKRSKERRLDKKRSASQWNNNSEGRETKYHKHTHYPGTDSDNTQADKPKDKKKKKKHNKHKKHRYSSD
ncbi:unnamed protein product [Candidula unifasciata]|uniref:Peptidyl-prolyl cis-trans isomerase n=1 Tax=Candidula unifasciata TaxID=100452 RepID=A0A8S3ZDG9_9EUPU|nr:unnamed protein product [Candidula unifasciata]